MDKRIKIYIGLFALIVALLVYADATKQKPINWFPSYAAKDKIPYGTYILRNELPKILPNTPIKDIQTSPYVFLQDEELTGTYFFIDGAVNFGEDEFNELLNFVDRGNDVFLSTNGAMIDTLGIKTNSIITTDLNEKVSISLLNPEFSNKEYAFDRSTSKINFSKLDTLHTIALGKISVSNDDDEVQEEGVNFIKHRFGKGNFYIHTFPKAFTNYNIIHQKNEEYVAGVLSYLDETKPILWDMHYKTGKVRITSKMNYILTSKSLKYAYFTVLIGVLFFIVFKGKREQRIIPIITPLKNQTLAFTRTISNMYYEKSKHEEIAAHKTDYFLEWIRSKLHIPTEIINTTFIAQVASRSSNSEEDTQKLFKKIQEIQQQQQNVSKEQLIQLNSLIEAFKSKI